MWWNIAIVAVVIICAAIARSEWNRKDEEPEPLPEHEPPQLAPVIFEATGSPLYARTVAPCTGCGKDTHHWHHGRRMCIRCIAAIPQHVAREHDRRAN
jgi:hypothetical protein